MAYRIFTICCAVVIGFGCYLAYQDGKSEYAWYYGVVFSVYVLVELITWAFKKKKQRVSQNMYICKNKKKGVCDHVACPFLSIAFRMELRDKYIIIEILKDTEKKSLVEGSFFT